MLNIKDLEHIDEEDIINSCEEDILAEQEAVLKKGIRTLEHEGCEEGIELHKDELFRATAKGILKTCTPELAWHLLYQIAGPRYQRVLEKIEDHENWQPANLDEAFEAALT